MGINPEVNLSCDHMELTEESQRAVAGVQGSVLSLSVPKVPENVLKLRVSKEKALNLLSEGFERPPLESVCFRIVTLTGLRYDTIKTHTHTLLFY